jgi:endonuclease YncB( thermonuclease family)
MTSVSAKSSVVALLMTALPYPVHSADILRDQRPSSVAARSIPVLSPTTKISGRTFVIDGRTLWFPTGGHKIRLASIDACELPQWSYDPRRHGESTIPKPVPCGPLAKAWLKRTVGSAQVTCIVRAHDADGALLGYCSVRGRDLALEMVRVGWARVTSPAPAEYLSWQNYAMSARHGMWATYVLDRTSGGQRPSTERCRDGRSRISTCSANAKAKSRRRSWMRAGARGEPIVR